MRALLVLALIYWISNSVTRKEEASKKDMKKTFTSHEDKPFESKEELKDELEYGKRKIFEELENFDLKDLTNMFFEDEKEEEYSLEEDDLAKEVEPVIASDNSMENKVETSLRELPRMEFEREEDLYKKHSKSKGKKVSYTKDKMRKDIVKGFIFSEIIKEPKSLRDKNESI